MRYSVSELVKIFGKTQPTISKWIRSVDDGGLLSKDVQKEHVFLVSDGKRKRYEIDDVAFAELTKQRDVVLEKNFEDNDLVSKIPDVKKEVILKQQEKQIDLMKSMIMDLRSTNETYKKTIDTYNSIIENQKNELERLKKDKKWWQFWK